MKHLNARHTQIFGMFSSIVARKDNHLVCSFFLQLNAGDIAVFAKCSGLLTLLADNTQISGVFQRSFRETS
jgi:hypothetical protein